MLPRSRESLRGVCLGLRKNNLREAEVWGGFMGNGKKSIIGDLEGSS